MPARRLSWSASGDAETCCPSPRAWEANRNPQKIESVIVQAPGGKRVVLSERQMARLQRLTEHRRSAVEVFRGCVADDAPAPFTLTLRSKDRCIDFAVREDVFRYRTIKLPVTLVLAPRKDYYQRAWIQRHRPGKAKPRPLLDYLRDLAGAR